VIVASTTGVSAIIAPDGTLLATSRTWQQAEIEARVPLITTTTVADTIGGWPEGLITVATLAALAMALAGLIRKRRREVGAAPHAGVSPPEEGSRQAAESHQAAE
jgi:apolipoprotein N-acyltransferase